jgi:hypothetical protein
MAVQFSAMPGTCLILEHCKIEHLHPACQRRQPASVRLTFRVGSDYVDIYARRDCPRIARGGRLAMAEKFREYLSSRSLPQVHLALFGPLDELVATPCTFDVLWDVWPTSGIERDHRQDLTLDVTVNPAA